ncbi:MAG: serine/threonine-protein kinase [Myxococcota bacterium]
MPADERPVDASHRFGPYTLLDRIAVGGMAEVFRAHEPRPAGEPRMVAVKRMLPRIASERGAEELFQEEARLGERIRHPNVVDVLGFGEENGQPYLVLEYVPGTDLWRLTRHLTRQGIRVDVDLAVLILTQLLSALHAVHEVRDEQGGPLGAVHRDVSPSNVLISVHGDVKLADFGIATTRHRQGIRQGGPRERAKGKLGYLAPEQVTGRACDRRTDVFAAGVIFAELLMGRPLFAGGSELAVLLAIRDARIHPFLEIASELADGLSEIVQQALAQDPTDRLPSAAAFAAALRPYQHRSDEELHPELGELAVAALRAVDEDAPSKTPLLEEQELSVETPAFGEAADGPEPFELNSPSTTEVPVLEYEIQTVGGTQLGPWAYARLVEAVAVGKLGPGDRVRKPGEQYEPIAHVPLFARHLPPSTMTPSTAQLDAPADPDEMVPLADGGITAALTWSKLRGDTGLWLCEIGGVRKEVYVKDGVPEFVTSNVAKELLGEYLVEKEVITRGELDMALAVMPRFEGRLGDTMSALGLMEPVELFQHIARQVRDKLLDLFLWNGGSASLYLGVAPPESGFPLGLDTWRLLRDGIDRRLRQGLEAERFHSQLDSVVGLAEPLPPAVDENQLPVEIRFVLQALRTPRPFGELETALRDPTGRDPGQVRRALIVLSHLGVLRWS